MAGVEETKQVNNMLSEFKAKIITEIITVNDHNKTTDQRRY